MIEPSAPPMYTETENFNDKKRKASSDLSADDFGSKKKGYNSLYIHLILLLK